MFSVDFYSRVTSNSGKKYLFSFPSSISSLEQVIFQHTMGIRVREKILNSKKLIQSLLD